MAWDEGEFCGQAIMTGDKPFDEFALALTRIVDAYLDRYDRKPTVAEALYSFKLVMRANSGGYFCDPATLANICVTVSEAET